MTFWPRGWERTVQWQEPAVPTPVQGPWLPPPCCRIPKELQVSRWEADEAAAAFDVSTLNCSPTCSRRWDTPRGGRCFVSFIQRGIDRLTGWNRPESCADLRGVTTCSVWFWSRYWCGQLSSEGYFWVNWRNLDRRNEIEIYRFIRRERWRPLPGEKASTELYIYIYIHTHTHTHSLKESQVALVVKNPPTNAWNYPQVWAAAEASDWQWLCL